MCVCDYTANKAALKNKKFKSFNNVCFLFSITHYRTETTTSWVNQRNICHLQLPTMSQQTTSLPTRQIYAITQTEQNSTSSLDQLINSGTFIDHRKSFDWANAHSSPTNRRRKSNGSFRNQKSNKDPPSLPLTNRNLQTLIRRSSTIEDPISPTAVAIDIDKFTNEQRLFAKSNTWQDHYEDRDDEQYSYSEFGESNPSSEHSSDSTSLMMYASLISEKM